MGFMAFLAVQDYLAGVPPAVLLIVRAAIPFALFLYFLRRGCYPELHGFRPGGMALADVCVGLLVAIVWIAPYAFWEGLRPEPGGEFNPDAAGPDYRALIIGLRLLGFAAVTPFIEELFVRSFLLRAADSFDKEISFRDIPVGQFAWRSFLVTLAWFTFTHAQWEWPVALAAGVIYNFWLYQRKHIGALVVAHATTNAALLAAVAVADAMGVDWWFFL